jgi:hypothetical protein
MSLITTAFEPDLLRPGLAAVFMNHEAWPDQWKEIFSVHRSDKQQEIEVEMRALPTAALKPEGTQTLYADMGEMYKTSYVNQTIAIGYMITAEAISDNLYKTQFPQGNRALSDSLRQFKNIQGANVLNNAFNTNYPIGDGQPLCSTSHPIYTGTVSNTLSTPAALNETSLQDALITLDQFQSASGIKVQTKAKKLIVPSQLQFTADVLLGSKYQINTANNNISALYNMKSIPMGAYVNQFLTNPLNWFVITDEPNGFKHYIREGVSTDMFTDIDANVLKVRAFERYSFGVSNFRAVVGVQGL